MFYTYFLTFLNTRVFKSLFALFLLLTFVSCATTSSKNSQNDEKVARMPSSIPENYVLGSNVTIEELDEDGEAIGPSVDDELYVIRGSSKIGKDGKSDRPTYYLHGAEQLKLDNYYFDFPVVYNSAVKKWLDYFLNKGRGFFERYSARAGRYAPLLGTILENHGLPRDLIFLAMAESGFQNNAKSWAQAVGPWQFMKYTGRRYGLKIDWYVDERRDPIKSTIASGRYLTKLYNDFGSWELAAAAYNAGEGRVGRALSRSKADNFWDIRSARYLKAETRNYVPKIMALAIIGKNLKSFGFEDINFHEPLDFEEAVVSPGTDLMMLAENLGIDYEEIQVLNPELLRWFVPHNVEEYNLRLPVGFKEKFDSVYPQNPDQFMAQSFQKHKVVGKNQRLSNVASKYKLRPYVLEDLNKGLTARKRLNKGQEIILPFRVGQRLRDPMYADLYELPRKEVRRKNVYRQRIALAKKRGKKITSPSEYYTVRKGDSLWTVARKHKISLDTLIVSNLTLINSRMIRVGDKLVIR